MIPCLSHAIRLYVGGLAAKVRGVPVDQGGYRCYSAAWSPRKIGKVAIDPNEVIALLDSGAFTDVKDDARLDPEQSLKRQLQWERDFSEMCGASWRAEMLVSYDRAGVRSQELTANANVAWWIDHLARLRETARYARAVREHESGIWRAKARTVAEVEWAVEQADLFGKAA